MTEREKKKRNAPSENGVDDGVSEEHAQNCGEGYFALYERKQATAAVEPTHETDLKGERWEETPESLFLSPQK